MDMRLVLVALSSAALAGCATTGERPRFPELNPFSPPEQALAFAIERGCVPLLQSGADPVAELEHSGMIRSYQGRSGVQLYSRAVVYVQDKGSTGCYVRVERADAAKMRQTVFDTLDRLGMAHRIQFDSGERSWTSGEPHRQEVHCIAAWDGGGMVISSTTKDRLLQLSMLKDPKGPCGTAS